MDPSMIIWKQIISPRKCPITLPKSPTVPILLGRSMQLFRHLELQNPSIISDFRHN